jgi:ribonuclease HII
MKAPEFLPIDHPMLSLEREKWESGITVVAGVDEAGRGPLAGPVVVAAVVFPRDALIPPVNDSKKLTAKQREEFKNQILKTPGVKYSIQTISAETIDSINILQATYLGMRKAVSTLKNVEFAFIDGLPVPDFPVENKAVVKGDAKSASIAAASILAKTHRDALMLKFAKNYPEYGFEKNSGYGTAEHLAALKIYGISPIHRKTFGPVRDTINPPAEQLELGL